MGICRGAARSRTGRSKQFLVTVKAPLKSVAGELLRAARHGRARFIPAMTTASEGVRFPRIFPAPSHCYIEQAPQLRPIREIDE